MAFKFTRVLSSYSGVSIRRVIYNRVGSPVVRRLIFNLPVAFIHCQRSPPTNVRYKLCVELKVGRVPYFTLCPMMVLAGGRSFRGRVIVETD